MAMAMPDPSRPPAAPTKPLRHDGMLRCPLCLAAAPEWRFTRYPPNPDYREQLWPTRRCPLCRKHFALKDD